MGYLENLHLHLVTRNNSLKKAKEKPQTCRLLYMEEFDKAVVKIIMGLLVMFTVMFLASISLEAYKVSQGITKQCQCNK